MSPRNARLVVPRTFDCLHRLTTSRQILCWTAPKYLHSRQVCLSKEATRDQLVVMYLWGPALFFALYSRGFARAWAPHGKFQSQQMRDYWCAAGHVKHRKWGRFHLMLTCRVRVIDMLLHSVCLPVMQRRRLGMRKTANNEHAEQTTHDEARMNL